MTIIVTDDGFTKNTSDIEFAANGKYVDLPSDTQPNELSLDTLDAELIRIDFPSFADGRGFSIAAQLRRIGFKGTIRAYGHVIADQYAMARRSGFDEVEISEDLAARQPEKDWLARANWRDFDYQNRLKAG